MNPTTTADTTAAGPETPEVSGSVPARITDPTALPPQRGTTAKFAGHELVPDRPLLLRPGTLVQGRLSLRVGVVMPYEIRSHTVDFPVNFSGVTQRCFLDDVQPPL